MVDLLSLLMGNRKPIAQPSAPAAKQVNAAIKKRVAEQFVAARELNGFTQIEAAQKMGYKNSTQLCQWEKAQRIPPIDRMLIASIVYGVSLDFLYGLSDEPERDPRFAEQRAMVRSMRDIAMENVDAVTLVMLKFSRSGGPNMLTVKALNARAADASAAVRRFVEINGDKFDRMRGGATMMHSCVALEALVRETTTMIGRQDGLKEQVMRASMKKKGIHHPLFDSAEYRQGTLSIPN